MRTTNLGTHGPELSVIGFGAWEAGGTTWGPNPADKDVISAMRAGFDAGMNWIDTAEVYGDGVSEGLTGRAVSGRREEIIVATKVAPTPEGTGFRPEEIVKAADASLARLGIDVIDLYQLHWPDGTGMPVEDTWGAMAGLVDAGKVRWIGVSNFDRALIERCEPIKHVDSLQQEFSMLVLEDRELIRWCGEVGTGVLSYSPLRVGFLAGALTRERAETLEDWRAEEGLTAPDVLDRAFGLLERLRPIAARIGGSLAQLALAWNHHQPGVTSAIAGSRDAGHTRENATAGDIELDAATLAELDAIVAA